MKNIGNDEFSSSLLMNICVDQVNDLINEEKLKLEGYKISYIIDPYDIQNYCFPFGLTSRIDIDSFRKKMSENDKIDEFISFDFLFQDKNSMFYVLDEHIDELYDFQVAIRNQILLGLKTIDTNKILLDKYLANKSDYEKIALVREIKEPKISLILSIAMGYLRKGLSKIDTLTQEEKRIIRNDYKDIEDVRVLEIINIISNIDPSALSNRILEFSITLIERFGKNEYDIANKKFNLKNDSDVVDRVISINKKLINIESKNLICFISSTSSSFRWFQQTNYPIYSDNFISEINSKINHLIKDSLPTINNSKINPHRTSSQLFLSLILDEKCISNKIKNLEKFRDSIAINFKHNLEDYNIDIKDDFWKMRIQMFRDKSENFAILSQYSRYRDTILGAKKIHKLKKYNSLIAIFDFILEKGLLKREIKNLRDQNWSKYNYENKFLDSYRYGIRNLSKYVLSNNVNKEELIINLIQSDNDKIAGRYHILPIIFYLKNKNSQNIHNLYKDLIFTTKIKDGANLVYFNSLFDKWISEIEKGLIEMNKDKEIELMRCLILLLLPGISNREEIILKRIDEILKYELNDETDVYLKQEYYYLGAWLSRRKNDLPKAEKYTKLGMKYDEYDPRFYHSKSLTTYCKISINDSIESQNKLLEITIDYANKAIILYKLKENRIEILKSIISLNNTVVYCRCLIWYNNYLNEILSDDIKNIRQLFDNEIKIKEDNFYRFLELIHTEAFLEFLEFFYYRNKGHLTLSSNKIYSALLIINKALELDINDQDCIDLQSKILTVINTYCYK